MGFISIQSLTLTLSVCLVIISGGLTGYMSISTGETALDDTRSMYEKGLADTESARDESLSACFTAGTSNSEELAGQLMAKVTDGIVSDLRGYLQVPKSIVTAMAHFGRLQGACTDSRGVIKDCPWLRPEWHRDVLQPMLYSMYRDARDLGVTEAVVLSLPYDMMQMQMYSHSPFTQTAANRERLGIPDDYRQDFHISWPAQTTCTLDMDRANCLARKPAPPFMDPAAWERGGEYPGTGGCTWCVRDTATNLKLSPFEPRYRRAGSCSDGNGCKYGFKNENTAASPEQKWRPWFTLSTPPAENGASIFGPCRDLKQAAQEAGRFPMTCPVPEVLQRFDYAMYRGLSLDVHAQQRDVLWSAPTAKGPFAALQVYSAWGHPDQWDYGDGLGNRIGLATAGVDLLSLSGMMKDIIGPLSPGTYLYAVQQDPWKLRAPPTNFKCVDDPHGLMAFAGISCSLLVGILGLSCETDLQSFSSTLKAYTWLYDNCPVSCNACPTDDGHGLLLGSSHGLAYEPLPLNESSYGDQGMADSLPINIRNAPDPVVRTHGRHVLSMRGADNRTMGYASVPSDIARWTYNPQDAAVNITSVTGAVREMPPGDGEPVLFWVKFGHLSDDAGLRLTIALLIPRDEAMKTIDIATAKTRTEAEQAAAAVRLSIQQSSDKTDEDKDDNFMLMIIIVVVACVVLIIISIVFVLSIIKPLLKLEQDMADVATMKLENVDLEEDPSKLEEVGNMQRSFITMVKNLIEYRNYMPQSILCGGEEEEEEEDDEKRPSAASSAQGSGDDKDNARGHGSKSSRESSSVKPSAGAKSSRGSMMSKVEMAKAKLTQEGLKKKAVSLLTINIRDFHSLMSTAGDAKTGDYHSAILTGILEVLGPSSKGVPDVFSGDRLCASWNAVKPCTTHRDVVPQLALQLQEKMGTIPGAVSGLAPALKDGQLRFGLAVCTGDARVGNLGCPGMKRFSVMSPMFTWLCGLERFGRHLNISMVADQWLQREAANSYLFSCLGVVSFPKRHAWPILAWELLGKKAVHEDEWMYQLEQGEKDDPYASWNKLVIAAAKFNADEMKEHLPGATAEGKYIPNATLLEGIQRSIESEQRLEPVALTFH